MFRNAEFRNAWQCDIAGTAESSEQLPHTDDEDVIFLLGLEPSVPNADWSTSETILDSLVKAFQPAPIFTHVELFLPPSSKESEVTFATYLGKHAGWGSSFSDSPKFYIGGTHSWRAIPVRAKSIASTARLACASEEGAPYSLMRYLTSVPPGRALAAILPNTPRSPGHCATISTRVLQRSGVHFPQSPAWYSPSTLYIELSKPTRTKRYARDDNDQHHVRSLVETERIAQSVEAILRGSDDRVRCLTLEDCKIAVDHLQKQVIAQRALEIPDPVREAALERNLAKALLRWGQVQTKASKSATNI